jgi:hypothetical protein
MVAAGLVVGAAQAQPLAALRVVDCQGKTRALKNVSLEELTDIEVALNSTEVGDLKLINAKGEEIRASISDDVATFSDVPTDIWVLTTTTPGAFYTKISFDPSPQLFWIRAGEVALVAVGVVGAVALTGAFDGGGSGGDSDGGSGDGICATCNPDQEAPSIGPFSITR